MKQIGAFIKPQKQKAANSERSELIGYFHKNVNADRGGRKPLPIRAIAVKLGGLKLPDLYYLKSICEDEQRRGGSWSKTFWGALKPRPNEA
jgi:hypothetical protein